MLTSPLYLLSVLAASIILLILLINWKTKLHPFLALIIVAFLVLIASDHPVNEIPDTLIAGAGETLGESGVVIMLGAVLGKLLAESGAVSRLADLILEHASPKAAPWFITLAAFIIAIPIFFEVGLVVLIPIIYAVALRLEIQSGRPKNWYLRILIPAIAAPCCLHGMVPPHPGPTITVTGLGANMGLTIMLGIICAIPTVIIAGPLYARLVAPRIQLEPPASLIKQYTGIDPDEAFRTDRAASPLADGDPVATSDPTTTIDTLPQKRMGTGVALLCILVPVVLMMFHSVIELIAPDSSLEPLTEMLGNPVIAMLIGVIVTSITVAFQSGITGKQIRKLTTSSMSSVASVVMIVAGGGAFNEALKDSGTGDAILQVTSGMHINLILMGWFIGLLLSFCTGSATAGIVAATGVIAPLAEGLSSPYLSLLVIAVGSGTIGLNRVNHAGFWFVKESFGMTLDQATKTHMVVQTIVSVLGLICTLILSLFIAA